MSEEIEEVIRRAYEAWHLKGLDAFAEFWADDVRWRSIEGAPDDRGPMRGRPAVRAFIQDWVETFDHFYVDVVEIVKVDAKTAVAALRFGGRARHSGIELSDTRFAAVFVVEAGRIVDCAEFESRSKALEAAGALR
jgi:ketosteroid isomerase-like protein